MSTEFEITEPGETEVGSYFITNYPPYSVWDKKYLPDAMRALQ